jgi:hypothetical protein
MDNPITPDFIKLLLHQVHPNLTISDSSISYLQLLFDPYFESVKDIPSTDALLRWCIETLPGELVLAPDTRYASYPTLNKLYYYTLGY